MNLSGDQVYFYNNIIINMCLKNNCTQIHLYSWKKPTLIHLQQFIDFNRNIKILSYWFIFTNQI